MWRAGENASRGRDAAERGGHHRLRIGRRAVEPRVGAHVVRTRTQGIVEGEARGTIRFKYMARDGSSIQVGDLVVTSGGGGLFPRGLPVGRVRAIDDRGSALFHYAELAPAVDFARIDEVLLIVGEGAHDVAAFFPEPSN